MSSLFGPMLVLVFCVSQALRDVYFGNVFQGVDFFAIIFLAFLISTLIFNLTTLIRAPGEFRRLREDIGAVIGMNLTTALAWSCYFFALSQIEPSIVNTVHSAMGPLVVVGMGVAGFALAQTKSVTRGELAGYATIIVSIIGLWWVVLSGRSGMPIDNLPAAATGLGLLLVGGTSITISMLFSKRLHDRGIGADAVTAVRYIALVILSGGIELWKGRLGGIETPGQLALLSVTTTILIVLPLFALQVGTAYTRPLTSNTIRALGPVFIFALEQIDGRLHYSTLTLICILVYSAGVILSNIAHGWRHDPAKRDDGSAGVMLRGQTPPVRG